MDAYDYLRFAALVHDLGKIWNRKQHERFTIYLLKSVNFLVPDEKMKDIICAIDKTHSFGNLANEYWLLKIADRKASSIQRDNGIDSNIDYNIDNKFLKSEVPESLLPTVQRILYNQFREHFIINDFDLSSLRKFISGNQWLEIVRSDVNDCNETSLREHLLMTEQILNILIKYIEENPTKNISDLQKSKSLDRYVKERIKEISKPDNKIDLKTLSKLVCNHQSKNDEIAVQFKITTEQIKHILENDEILIANGGSHADYKSIVIPVSTIAKFMFCNYQPYLQYVKYGKKIKINGDPVKNGDSSHKHLLKKEREEKIIGATTFMDSLKQSFNSDKTFVFHEIFLKSEIIPGIILIGSVDRLDVWKSRVVLTERKFVKNRTALRPYENEIVQLVAYALLLKKNFGLRFEDIHCSIEFFDRENKQLLKKIPIEIDEKYIGIIKKLLWDLGAIMIGAKIPEPTKNENKCRVCRLNAKAICDKAAYKV